MKSKSFSFKKWARSRAGQQVFICIGFMVIPLLLLFLFTYFPFAEMIKFSQLPGNAITLVFWYSASVLNAVVIQETIGMIAQNPKKISDAYSTIVQIMLPTE
jgi:hypothetical protein